MLNGVITTKYNDWLGAAEKRLCESLELCFFFLLYHIATRLQSMGRKETARHIDLPYRGAVFAPALQMIEEPANAVINQLATVAKGPLAEWVNSGLALAQFQECKVLGSGFISLERSVELIIKSLPLL